eukprot:864401-Rhodomonas_salina.3
MEDYGGVGFHFEVQHEPEKKFSALMQAKTLVNGTTIVNLLGPGLFYVGTSLARYPGTRVPNYQPKSPSGQPR